jgi:hypothetical protein
MKSAIRPLLLVASGFAATAQAQSGTLTLACNGTRSLRLMSEEKEKPKPISMGIVVNLDAGTVQGFGNPGELDDFPVRISATNDVVIAFWGSNADSFSKIVISGDIGRVTGDVEADVTSSNLARLSAAI